MHESNLLTVKEAAKELGIGVSTVYRWIEAGKLKSIRVTDDAIRIVGDTVRHQVAIREARKCLLTIDEAADELRVCASTVHNLIKQGRLPVIRVTDKAFRIDPSDIKEYLTLRKE